MSRQEDEDIDPLSDPEERRVLYSTLDSFRQYRQASHYNTTHLRRQAFYSLPSSHIDLLSSPPFNLPSTFDAIDSAIESNANLSEAFHASAIETWGLSSLLQASPWKGTAKPNDTDKARSTLRQLYRDWSAEGLPERHATFQPIFSALQAHLPPLPISKRHAQRILVPGAGLGRLLFDLICQGYTAEGNEFSYHMLMASNYILNHSTQAGQHTLHPFVHSFSNHLSRANQLRSVKVPDVHPATELMAREAESELHFSERMGFTTGDFSVVYRRKEYEGAFDAVATLFFIDTAPNFLAYVETVRHALKVGGVWVNVGPLLWHFESAETPAEKEAQRREGEDAKSEKEPEGVAEPGSFELTNDEVVAVLEKCGFEILEQKETLELATGYIQDPESMLQNVYRPSFWVARKK